MTLEQTFTKIQKSKTDQCVLCGSDNSFVSFPINSDLGKKRLKNNIHNALGCYTSKITLKEIEEDFEALIKYQSVKKK